MSDNIPPQLMWSPDPNKCTKMDELRNIINKKYNENLGTYKEFHRWSCDHYAEFWEEVWKFTNVVHSQEYDSVVNGKKNISEVPEWFHGALLNYAENLLRYDDDRIAIYATGEGQGGVLRRTFKELRQQVAIYASALKKMGVKKGDRVVGYIPNCIEAVEAMLATSSLGAIWSSTSPDFGVVGVLERFTQIQPKVIFSVNAVHYNGKVHSHMEKLTQVVEGLPDLEKVVLIPFVKEFSTESSVPLGISLEDFLKSGMESGKVPELTFEQVPFNHPLFIMYSSGTTGVPKCMVHSVGGTLMKHLEEHIVQGNMDRSDVMLYYTTAGWMMWNWMVSVLAVGAAIVLYDGSPLIPTVNVMWDIIDELGVTVLGTGAKWLAVLEDKGVKPGSTHKLTSLKAILSTGSPLKPQSYDFVYRDIKADLLLGSISGGTDIIACFMGHNWNLPVYRGEIQGVFLGCDMESWDEVSGKPVLDQSGELVCLKPFPSMPVRFWNDTDGSKYKKAYFNKFKGIWAHGDFCSISSTTAGVVMLGRSDGTLNPNGVRFGSAEVYHVVENFKEIEDSVCVAQRSKDNNEERVVLFLKMAPDSEFGPAVVNSLKTHIRTYLSARHVPAVIMPISDIPYTISGKKVEIAVKNAIAGRDVPQRGALSNPNSVDLYYNIEQLQDF